MSRRARSGRLSPSPRTKRTRSTRARARPAPEAPARRRRRPAARAESRPGSRFFRAAPRRAACATAAAARAAPLRSASTRSRAIHASRRFFHGPGRSPRPRPSSGSESLSHTESGRRQWATGTNHSDQEVTGDSPFGSAGGRFSLAQGGPRTRSDCQFHCTSGVADGRAGYYSSAAPARVPGNDRVSSSPAGRSGSDWAVNDI